MAGLAFLRFGLDDLGNSRDSRLPLKPPIRLTNPNAREAPLNFTSFESSMPVDPPPKSGPRPRKLRAHNQLVLIKRVSSHRHKADAKIARRFSLPAIEQAPRRGWMLPDGVRQHLCLLGRSSLPLNLRIKGGSDSRKCIEGFIIPSLPCERIRECPLVIPVRRVSSHEHIDKICDVIALCQPRISIH